MHPLNRDADGGTSDRSGEIRQRERQRQHRQTLARRRRVAEDVLIIEITAAARAIAGACDLRGEPVFRTDGVWRVLTTVATSDYRLAIADLGRALRIRRQVAHELAHQAARANLIDLVPNPDDRRLLQAFVTPKGRAALAAARSAERIWLGTLLIGLGDHQMATATQVVQVIRQRLERNAREWARIKAGLAKS